MGLMDFQLGIGTESAYGVAAPLTRFFEYESEGIDESYGRTEGDPLRAGSHFARSDRHTPYFSGAAGTVQMAVMTKGFGVLLPHLMGGAVATTVAETAAYTHTVGEGDLWGKSLTMQLGRPLNPSGGVQPFTYRGGKVTEWTLANSVDGNLLLDLGFDFQQGDITTALAAASYPAGMDNLTWAGGYVTIDGEAFDVTEIGLTVNNGLDTDRRQIRRNTDKKEPTSARREATFTLSADFDSMAKRNKAAALSKAGNLGVLTCAWEGPNVIPGTTLKPLLTVSAPAARFDEWSASAGGAEAITQELSGVLRFPGTGSPVTVAYRTADTAP